MKKNISVGVKRNVLNPNSMTFDERKKDLEAQREVEDQHRESERQSPFSGVDGHNITLTILNK